MKKIVYKTASIACLIFLGIMLMNVKVYAASNVASMSASGDTKGATVKGTTDDNVAAVLIEILDDTNQIVTLETHKVVDGLFNATLSCDLTAGKTYKAYVINYDGTGTAKEATFTVPIVVTGVSLNVTTYTLQGVGKTVQLTATINPANASNANVTWRSSSPTVATVDASGKVTAVGKGTTTITVETEDGNKTATAEIIVEIPSDNSGGNSDDNQNGNSNTGNTDQGNTDPGSTGSGDTGSGGTDTGNTESGSTDTGNSDTGSSDTGNSDTGNSNTVDTDTTDNTITTMPTKKPTTTTQETKPETTPDDTTGVSSSDGAEGWKDIKVEINDKIAEVAANTTDEAANVVVKMNGEDTVPADVFATIKGQNITVTFDMGNGISWSVNGTDVTGDNLADINLAAETGAGVTEIPSELISTLTENRDSFELTLEYEGEFGFIAVMSVNVDKKNAGKYANLFYFNPKTETMEFICSAQVKEGGTTDLTFTHASDYVIVVDEVAMSAANNITMDKVEQSAPQETPVDIVTPEEDVFNPFWIIVIGIVVLLVGGIAILTVKKKNE